MKTYNIKAANHKTGKYELKVSNLNYNQTMHIVRLLEANGESILIEGNQDDLYQEPNHELPKENAEIKAIKHRLHVLFVRIKCKIVKQLHKLFKYLTF